MLRALPIVLVSLSLLLFGIALAVSPGWRRQAVRAYGLGFIAAGALALAALSALGSEVTHTLARTEAAEPAVEQTWTIVDVAAPRGRGLDDRLRRADVPRRAAGGADADGDHASGGSWRRTCASRGSPTSACWCCSGWAILWWAPTPATRNPITALLLAILIALGFEGLRRRTAHEFPDADRKVAEQHGRERLARATAAVRSWGSGAGATIRQASPLSSDKPGNGGDSAAAHDERLARLEQLGRLHDAGTIDDDEFRTEKTRILSGAP